LNFFERSEQALLRALQRPECNIHGLRRADIKPFVPLRDSALSRQLHRLRALGMIKRVRQSYR
jgi:DNA-binding HxlR family transcriptional regulator